MLPDGAERQLEDWTIFFLNQTPFNTIAPVLALESETSIKMDGENGEGSELLYVLNLVRTKHDKTVRRCVINSVRNVDDQRTERYLLHVGVQLLKLWLYVLDTRLFKYSRYVIFVHSLYRRDHVFPNSRSC